jgi:Flp pilus assembly protein TadG
VLVEFAIVLPVLLMLILGIIDFGRFINFSDQQTQMAAQAARFAAVDVNPSTTQTLQAYIASQASGGLQTTGGDVTSAAQVYLYYPTGSSNAVGNAVRACVVSNVKLLPLLGGTTWNIVEAASMRIEKVNSTVWSTSNNPGAVPTACG